MGNESGTWIMHGVDREDPGCIHTVDELLQFIDRIGFVPLFKNDIPGFSVEEHTEAAAWWSGDPARDPWEWREQVAASGKAVYGKFFDKKAGFISLRWLPYFANSRRDGYDFDARWEDEKASYRQKRIMDIFETREEIFSNELKELAGFGKGGEKNFDGVLTELQNSLYLCVKDFRQRKNKKGVEYGWPIAVYAMPEQIWGYEAVCAGYKESPEQSGERIRERIKELYPAVSRKQLAKYH